MFEGLSTAEALRGGSAANTLNDNKVRGQNVDGRASRMMPGATVTHP